MSKRKKMLVVDIDGTLVNDEKEITKKTLEKLHMMIDEGHYVVIATGRPTKGVKKIAKKLNFDNKGGYVVSFNGARVVDWKSEEVLYEKSLENKFIPEILEKVREYDLGFVTYDKDHIIAGTDVDEYMSLESKITDISVKEPDDFFEYVNFDVSKCIITCDPKIAGEFESKFQEMSRGRYEVYRSADFFIDVVAKGVDKYSAVEELAKKLGVDHRDVICCGDSYNDISMIEGAGIGVAMGNAVDEAKSVADYVTLSNNDDGIAKVIDKFVFNIA